MQQAEQAAAGDGGSSPAGRLRRLMALSAEGGLDLVAFLLVPLLVLAPRGVAGLAGVAGALAAGLLATRAAAARRTAILAWLRPLAGPAALLAAVLLSGALSALWSIDPARSIVTAARLAGLFAVALALAAAAPLVAAPRRLAGCFLAGLAAGAGLASAEFATDGALTRPFFERAFLLTRLNQASIAMAILLPPATGMLLRNRRPLLAGLLATALAAVILLLVGTAAKAALTASLPLAALLYGARRSTARALAILSMLVIVTAPLTFPRLERLPALLDSAEAFKSSASHRLLIWSFAGDRIAERPLLGWGLDAARAIPGGREEIRPFQSWMPLHPHNSALQLWLELGVLGSVPFALLVGSLWLRLGAAAWPRASAATAGASLAAALIASLGTYGIWQEWFLGTLALSLFLVLVIVRVAPPAPARHR